MSALELAEDAKRNNILDMALTFTAMMRVFSKGSKQRIARQLRELTSDLPAITSAEGYEQAHKAFCEWFCREIHTAERKLKNGKTKISKPTSYGQAAKVLDIDSRCTSSIVPSHPYTRLPKSAGFFMVRWTSLS